MIFALIPELKKILDASFSWSIFDEARKSFDIYLVNKLFASDTKIL